MEKRFVDTQAWLSEISDIVSGGKEVSLNVTGSSMLPFLKGGRDRVLLTKFTAPANKGDILLYRRKSGEYVLHRVVKNENGKLYFAGDIQSVVEGPVEEEAVKAKVKAAERNGRWITEDSREWNFFKDKWSRTLHLRKYFSRIIYIINK